MVHTCVTYIYIYINIYLYAIHAYISTHICIKVGFECYIKSITNKVSRQPDVCTRKWVYVHKYVLNIFIPTYIHTHIYTYIHTHICKGSVRVLCQIHNKQGAQATWYASSRGTKIRRRASTAKEIWSHQSGMYVNMCIYVHVYVWKIRSRASAAKNMIASIRYACVLYMPIVLDAGVCVYMFISYVRKIGTNF
jgi:hypothetical protein